MSVPSPFQPARSWSSEDVYNEQLRDGDLYGEIGAASEGISELYESARDNI